MAITCLFVALPFQAECVLCAVMYAGKAELAFPAVLKTVVCQSEIAARAYLGAGAALYTLGCIQFYKLFAGLGEMHILHIFSISSLNHPISDGAT